MKVFSKSLQSPVAWLECIVFKSWIFPHPLELLHHGLLEEPQLIEDLGLDEDGFAGLRVLLDHLWYLDEGFLVQIKYICCKNHHITSSFPIIWRLLLLTRNPSLSSWSKLKPNKEEIFPPSGKMFLFYPLETRKSRHPNPWEQKVPCIMIISSFIDKPEAKSQSKAQAPNP